MKDAKPLTISVKAPHDGHVTAKIFDMNAQLVRVAMEADTPAGAWTRVDWNGCNGEGELLGSGVYFVSIQGAGINKVLPVVLIK